MARFGSVGMIVVLAALAVGAGVWSSGCKPGESTSSSDDRASSVPEKPKDVSRRGSDRGSGPATSSPVPSKTEEPAKPEPADDGETKPASPTGGGKEDAGEGDAVSVRNAKTGQTASGVTITRFDPTKEPKLKPNPIPTPEPNPSSIEGLKAVTTESGLKYWDIKVGEGDVPHEEAMVIIDYRCWLADGTMADSAWHQRWYPTYRKNGIIPGLAEAIWSTRMGGIRQAFIPSALGFGETGYPRKGDGPKMIPPNADLKFEFTLQKVIQPPKQTSVDGLVLKRTASGVKYWDIKIGEGDTAETSSDIKARFTSWSSDGKMLMTTEFAKKPQDFQMWNSNVMGGLRHGVPGMRVGGKRRIEIPPDLASGVFSDTSAIIIELELVETAIHPSLPTQSSVLGLPQKTTASGLTFWDIEVGAGATPEATSTVTIYYTIWLDDGSINITSEMSGGPVRLPVDKLFDGFRETISTMKVGGIRQAKIPPNLAYGEKGQPPSMPPNATLILELQLLDAE